MVRQAFIHIGMEKTGTKSLQDFLTTNAAVLQAKGYSYLCDEGRPYFQDVGHFPVAACFAAQCPEYVQTAKFRPAAEVLTELRRDVEACEQDIILSCEHFSSRLREAAPLQAIREALANRRVRIVCYLRRQDDFALAAYSTAVLSGRRDRFDIEQVTPKHRFYNFYETLELWAGVFGRDNVLVREYDRARLVGGDIRRDFLDLLGIEETGFRYGEDKNVSLSAQQVEALRLVNAFLPRFDEGGSDSYELAMTIRRMLIDHLPQGDPLAAMLGPAQRRAIQQAFAPSNARVMASFAGCDFLANWHRVQVPRRTRPLALTRDDLAGTIAKLGLLLAEAAAENARLKTQLPAAEAELAGLRERLTSAPLAPTPRPAPAQPPTPIRVVRDFVLAVQRGLGRGDQAH